MTIGRWTGMIDYLDVDGESMLVDRESITPEFWRAPTDNDYGAGLQRNFAVWKNPKLKIIGVNMSGENKVVSEMEIPAVKAKLTITYTLTEKGEVLVNEKMTLQQDAKASDMFRYGMQLQMPEKYNKISYYGRGPQENYVDRHGFTFIGNYDSNVKDEYYSYIRPQESGNHTDIRTFAVYNPTTGKGLEFYGIEPMECSALNYLISDLDDGPNKDHKWGHHSGDLIERNLTQVIIQKEQYGLGCVNSWGAWPRPEYRVNFKDKDFTFVIRPYKK